MRKLFFLIPLLLLLFSLFSFAQTKNLLENGGFEKGLIKPWGTGQFEKGKALWWNSGGCNSFAAVVKNDRYEGSSSLYIKNVSGRAPDKFGTICQRVPVKKGCPYLISFYAMGRNLASNSAVSLAVDVKWLIRPISLPAGSFNWKYFSGVFKLQTDFAEIRIISEDSGEVWIDDIEVTEIEGKNRFY